MIKEHATYVRILWLDASIASAKMNALIAKLQPITSIPLPSSV